VKQIIAIVKPFLAEKVLDALKRAPLEALNVREVKGYGRQKSYLDQYGDSEYSLAFLPKVEITLWVDDARVEETMRKIVEVARTGRMGDGKIFVMPAFDGESIDIASGKKTSAATNGQRKAEAKKKTR
jgi:nitrogen regulatory protein P-II 1